LQKTTAHEALSIADDNLFHAILQGNAEGESVGAAIVEELNYFLKGDLFEKLVSGWDLISSNSSLS
jgi:hypothetical protein